MVNALIFHKQKIWSKFTRVCFFIHLICSLHIVRQGSKEILTRMIFSDIQENLYAHLNEEVGLETLLVIMFKLFIWNAAISLKAID